MHRCSYLLHQNTRLTDQCIEQRPCVNSRGDCVLYIKYRIKRRKETMVVSFWYLYCIWKREISIQNIPCLYLLHTCVVCKREKPSQKRDNTCMFYIQLFYVKERRHLLKDTRPDYLRSVTQSRSWLKRSFTSIAGGFRGFMGKNTSPQGRRGAICACFLASL